jgi:hypothetical protein
MINQVSRRLKFCPANEFRDKRCYTAQKVRNVKKFLSPIHYIFTKSVGYFTELTNECNTTIIRSEF